MKIEICSDTKEVLLAAIIAAAIVGTIAIIAIACLNYNLAEMKAGWVDVRYLGNGHFEYTPKQ